MRWLSVAGLVCLSGPALQAQTLTIKTSPQTAEIFRVAEKGDSLIPLGTGVARFKLEENDPNRVVVRLEGYRDVSQAWTKGAKLKDKNISIVLTKRVVQVTAAPNDASIVVNGTSQGLSAAELELEEGQSASVEVRKAGYVTARRVYRHERNSEMPPPSERIELTDRLVAVSATPQGVELLRNGGKLATDSTDIAVPRGACVTVRAQKPGWIPLERVYCNKDGDPPPPLRDRLGLADRVVNLAAPAEARIFVNQKPAAVGSLSLRIDQGTCARIRVEKLGFLPDTREYCAKAGVPGPPPDEIIWLTPDESYSDSEPSEHANTNVAIEVAADRSDEQAWKALSSVVLNHFDVLENADRETGYLRTGWVVNSFAEGTVVVRTRLIVKRTADEPLRYTVKLFSERLRAPGLSVREDENFDPWPRLLNSFKDVIAELKARLQGPSPSAPSS